MVGYHSSPVGGDAQIWHLALIRFFFEGCLLVRNAAGFLDSRRASFSEGPVNPRRIPFVLATHSEGGFHTTKTRITIRPPTMCLLHRSELVLNPCPIQLRNEDNDFVCPSLLIVAADDDPPEALEWSLFLTSKLSGRGGRAGGHSWNAPELRSGLMMMTATKLAYAAPLKMPQKILVGCFCGADVCRIEGLHRIPPFSAQGGGERMRSFSGADNSSGDKRRGTKKSPPQL